MLESLGIPGDLWIHCAVPGVQKRDPWSHVLPLINPLTSVGFQRREDEEDLILFMSQQSPIAAFWKWGNQLPQMALWLFTPLMAKNIIFPWKKIPHFACQIKVWKVVLFSQSWRWPRWGPAPLSYLFFSASAPLKIFLVLFCSLNWSLTKREQGFWGVEASPL